jgi:hypothetical protein
LVEILGRQDLSPGGDTCCSADATGARAMPGTVEVGLRI